MSTEVILVTGVFDILHEEHVRFLQKALAIGGRLVVGIESDVRVRQLKGEGRPINTASVRVAQIEALQLAHEVFVLPEQFATPDDHRAVLARIRPTVLAVSQHSPHQEAKARLMQEIGGRLCIVHAHNPAVSTTQILAAQQKE